MNRIFTSISAAMLALMTAFAALDPIAQYPHLAVAQPPVLVATLLLYWHAYRRHQATDRRPTLDTQTLVRWLGKVWLVSAELWHESVKEPLSSSADIQAKLAQRYKTDQAATAAPTQPETGFRSVRGLFLERFAAVKRIGMAPRYQRSGGRSATMTPNGLFAQAAVFSTTLVQPSSRASKCRKASGASSSVNRWEIILDGSARPL